MEAVIARPAVGGARPIRPPPAERPVEEVAAGASPAVDTQLGVPWRRSPPFEAADVRFSNGLLGNNTCFD